MTEITEVCWICGNKANSSEHKLKKSDLRDLFGKPNQSKPLYFQDANLRNKFVGSLDAKILKSPKSLCAHCNSQRTQSHDFAWTEMSRRLRASIGELTSRGSFRASFVFPYDTKRRMLEVHLYFLKLFGCLIHEGDIPIDLSGFSSAIVAEKMHPNVYLKFGVLSAQDDQKRAGRTDVGSSMLVETGECAFLSWFYVVGQLSTNVMYAIEGEDRLGLISAWHPVRGTKRLVFEKF